LNGGHRSLPKVTVARWAERKLEIETAAGCGTLPFSGRQLSN